MVNKLSNHNIFPKNRINRNLSPDQLVKKALKKGEAKLSSTGAVVVYTGKYTGRSPNDRFIVDTETVHNKINWGKVNIPIESKKFERLYKKITNYLSTVDELFIFDGFAGADDDYKLQVRVISEYAYHGLFSNHLLRRPTKEELKKHNPQLTILCAPNCLANPKTDGTNSEVFVILNIDKMIALIGGTKYCGEVKKSIFTIMNYILPQRKVFPMHCSANMGDDGKTALFFGLSGTGKTTLSADPGRRLIGDDEHGWSKNGVFNLEGGCYAKCINLKKENEPQIWNAIKHGSLVENVVLRKDGTFDFKDKRHTENTRVAYPLEYIENAILAGVGPHPSYIVFLTADAFGVMPPVAKLDINGAMYHFLSGYTSKLAGTERGVTTPKATFSTCFGAPFMPLSPIVYANLLKSYMMKYKAKAYLVNTGWQGGPYGVGKRISIKDTRAIVRAILEGKLDGQEVRQNKLFNLAVPKRVNGVRPEILEPRRMWKDKRDYEEKSKQLARLFIDNFKNFSGVPSSVKNAGPTI